MQVGLLDQEVKEGYVAASKEAVLNYIMLDQVPFCYIMYFNLANVESGGKRSAEHIGGTKDVGSPSREGARPLASVFLAGGGNSRKGKRR